MTTNTLSTRTRTSFVGAHVEPETKTRLVRWVWRNKTSASSFIDEAIKEKLAREKAPAPPTQYQEAS